MGELKNIIVLNDTRVDQHHGSFRVMENLERGLKKIRGDIQLFFFNAHSAWANDEYFLSALKSARLMIINGEGTIHHDRMGALRLMECIDSAKVMGIPIALINATWQDNGSEVRDRLTKVDYLSVREGASHRELSDFGFHSDLTPDLSLLDLTPTFSRSNRSISLVSDSVKFDDALLLHSFRRFGFKLLPMYTHVGYNNRRLLLRRQCQKRHLHTLSNTLKTIRFAFDTQKNIIHNHDDFIANLNEASKIISGRFHMTTIAAGLGLPFVAIESNSHKVSGFLNDIGLESRLVELNTIANTSFEIPPFSQNEQVKILDYVASAQERIPQMLSSILKMI